MERALRPESTGDAERMKYSRILALDCATRTGWAHGIFRPHLDGWTRSSGAVQFEPAKTAGLPRLLSDFDSWLEKIVASMSVDKPIGLIVHEQPHHRGFNTFHLVGMAALVNMRAYRVQANVFSAHSASVKKHATGSGRAKKPEMIAAAKEHWPHVRDDDEADAMWILDYAIKQFGAAGE